MIKQSILNNNDEKFTVSDLIQYIKQNRETIDMVNYVDLTLSNQKPKNELKKLNFQNIQQLSYLPPKLNEIFQIENNKFFHMGVLQNVSFYSSLLVCLKNDFYSKPVIYQQKLINTLLESLKSDVKKFNYKKYNWNKDCLDNILDGSNIGSNTIKYVSDYLCINIFILDIANDKLMYGGGETYIPYKKTIFLINYEDKSFEPLYATEITRFFAVSDTLIKKIQNSQNNIGVYPLSNNMIFKLNICEEDLDVYLGKIPVQEEEVLPFKIYPQQELKKMKLNELQNIAKSHKIDIKIKLKNKTKEQLINEILSTKEITQ